MVAERAKQAAIKAIMRLETWTPSRMGPCSSPERINKIRDTALGIVEEVIRHIEPEDKGMFRKLSQSEYGVTARGSLANGALYVNNQGQVFFWTDADAHHSPSLFNEPSEKALWDRDYNAIPYPEAKPRDTHQGEKAAPMPGPFSCHVQVVSVGPNIGGEGSTALLQFEQGGGIDVRPGGPDTDYIMIQVTADTEELVKRGAIIKFTLSAIEETP